MQRSVYASKMISNSDLASLNASRSVAFAEWVGTVAVPDMYTNIHTPGAFAGGRTWDSELRLLPKDGFIVTAGVGGRTSHPQMWLQPALSLLHDTDSV